MLNLLLPQDFRFRPYFDHKTFTGNLPALFSKSLLTRTSPFNTSLATVSALRPPLLGVGFASSFLRPNVLGASACRIRHSFTDCFNYGLARALSLACITVAVMLLVDDFICVLPWISCSYFNDSTIVDIKFLIASLMV